jgi:hypothetical protein
VIKCPLLLVCQLICHPCCLLSYRGSSLTPRPSNRKDVVNSALTQMRRVVLEQRVISA